jgi:methylenetetrahydrofolate dehydrogenase (NADP+)/methenyltetrahydrofolate cyclohydrolase
MKELNGKELAGFIQERQAHTVRRLIQDAGVTPRLAIVRCNPDPVVDSYMRLKRGYGQDIGATVDVHDVKQSEAIKLIEQLNRDDSVHGVIVQIPLPDPDQTTTVLNAVSSHKDVDGLADDTVFDPATPLAILWLLAGYNVDLRGKSIVILGNGRLVGKPLADIMRASGQEVVVVDHNTPEQQARQATQAADIIICATGVPGLLTADKVSNGVVIIDAGVATDSNGLVGDVADDVRELADITITPKQGGVGPLTVCALFENLLKAAAKAAQ